MQRTQRGITLVEVLVTLAILSLIGTLVWGVFFQGFNYSQKAVTKNMLQQEATLIVTELTKIHQTSSEYTINLNTSESGCNTITINYKKKIDNSEHTAFFNTNGYCYSIDKTGKFDPNSDNTLNISISDKKDINNKVDRNIFLYRMN